MFAKLFFRKWPLDKQVTFLKKKGILIGSRTKDNRKIFIYMYRDLFAEVMFNNDDSELDAERVTLVKGLKNLNSYLENQFKDATF
jgi:hypothetical protein